METQVSVDGIIIIDLRGPQGNAFCLLGYAKKAGIEVYGNEKTALIIDEMTEGNYENLLNVFEKYFSDRFYLVGR